MNILINLFSLYLGIALVLAILKGKPNTSIMSCGIFGFCGPVNLSKSGWNAVLSNIKILGIYNDDRGGDNAGILINNEILHSESFIYKFSELIEKKNLQVPNPSFSTVVLGHSRKGSVGGKTHKNAHPFPIYRNENDADFYMAGVHNGTISNWKKLAENYAIDDKQIDNDSLTILTILSRQKNLKRNKPVFRVLEQYEGYGAFAWYFPEEPDTLYVFKGASRKYKYEKELTEERPLFYYECPLTKGVYLSSVEKGLKAISFDKDKIKEVPCNLVIKIVNGKLLSNDVINIDRTNVPEWFPTYNANTSIRYSGYEEDYNDAYGIGYGSNMSRNNFAVKTEKLLPPSPEKNSIVKEIFTHSSENKEKEKQMALSLNQIKDNVISYVSQSFDVPQKSIKDLEKNSEIYRLAGLYYANNTALDGVFIIDKKTFKVFKASDPVIQTSLKQSPNNYDVRYFFEGYLLKDMTSYKYLEGLRESNFSGWKADKVDWFMSKFCPMPVPGFSKPSIFYIAGSKATMFLANPSYSHGYIYEYSDGKLVSVKIPKKTENKKLIVNIEEIRKEATRLGIPIVRTKKDVESVVDSVIDPEENNDQKNSLMQIPVEIKYIIDSQEEEIVQLFIQLQEKCKEQIEILSPYIKNNTLEQDDFMSGIISGWFGDTIQDCLLSPSNTSKKSPYFEKENGEIVYIGLSKNYTLDLKLF